MENLILIIIGLIALGLIFFMMFRKTDSPCDNCSSNCNSCSLYKSDIEKEHREHLEEEEEIKEEERE